MFFVENRLNFRRILNTLSIAMVHNLSSQQLTGSLEPQSESRNTHTEVTSIHSFSIILHFVSLFYSILPNIWKWSAIRRILSWHSGDLIQLLHAVKVELHCSVDDPGSRIYSQMASKEGNWGAITKYLQDTRHNVDPQKAFSILYQSKSKRSSTFAETVGIHRLVSNFCIQEDILNLSWR